MTDISATSFFRTAADSTGPAVIGEPRYEPDDGEHKQLWDGWHPQLQPTMHRHLAVDLPSGHPAHDTRRPLHERAHALLDHVAQGAYTTKGLGYHWTDDPDYNHLATGSRIEPGQTAVTVHARTAPRHHIEDNTYVLEDRAVRDWSTDPEREVPLKRGAPVHVTGISWKSVDGRQHHTFDTPITHHASLRTTASAATWHTVRHYDAENLARRTLGRDGIRAYSDHGEAQTHADQITTREGLPPVKIVPTTHPDQSGYVHSHPHANGGAILGLGSNALDEGVLIHELTHHRVHHLGVPMDDHHAPAFADHLGQMLDTHHSNPSAGAAFRNALQHTDREMRNNPSGTSATFGTPYPSAPAPSGDRPRGVIPLRPRQAAVQDGDDIPSRLLNPHGHHIRARVGNWPNVEMVPRTEVERYASQDTDPEHAKAVGHHLATTGEMEPLMLHYHPASGEAYLGEGNHRLRAARTLQMEHLPVRVQRNNYGLPGPGVKVPQDHPNLATGEHIPHDIKPSDIGLTTVDKPTMSEWDKKTELAKYRLLHGSKTAATKPCPCCGGTGEHDTGFECYHCDGGLTVPADSPDDVRCDGRLPDGGHGKTAFTTPVPDNHEPYQHEHPWLPRGHFFAPGKKGLDPRLFDENEQMHPIVRQHILSLLNSFWAPKYGDSWQSWARVYLAGSEASHFLGPGGIGNGDLDILIGINYELARHYVDAFTGEPDGALGDRLTEELRAGLNDDVRMLPGPDGKETGPWENTWFVIKDPSGTGDIRNIKPYAAYDMTADDWAVRPVEVPDDFGPEKLPESTWDIVDAVRALVKAVGELPPGAREREGAALYDYLHTDRSAAFGEEGTGLYDTANVVFKSLIEAPGHPLQQLVDWKRAHERGSREGKTAA